MSTIELRGVTKQFGSFTAVKNVSLSVSAGEVVCLLGPSGCGKTTTLRIIAGLERASAGDVIIAGKRMNDLRPDQRDIAMVFQFYALYPALTVRENIMFPLHVEGLDAQTSAERVGRVARMLQLEPVLDRLPNHISEGEKQRVAVARAVVRDPNCFLFDEPLSRLDVELRQTMRGQIKSVLTGLSKATVIVTHDQLEALTMADRIAIMRDGVIEQIASPHEVFARPTTLFVASFIGTPQMNLLTAQFDGVEGAHGRFTVDGQPIRLAVDPAVKRLAKGQVTIGIRPRALLPDGAGRRRHDRRPCGTDRADGRRDSHPRPNAAWQRSPSRCAARDQDQVGRRAEPSRGCPRDACVRWCRNGGPRMSDETAIAGKRALGGIGPATAQRLEWSLIGLGILALALIFQPFSLALFGVGCALVVFAGLANNLLPLCQPGTTARSLLVASVIVALTFFVIMLISIICGLSLWRVFRERHRARYE